VIAYYCTASGPPFSLSWRAGAISRFRRITLPSSPKAYGRREPVCSLCFRGCTELLRRHHGGERAASSSIGMMVRSPRNQEFNAVCFDVMGGCCHNSAWHSISWAAVSPSRALPDPPAERIDALEPESGTLARELAVAAIGAAFETASTCLSSPKTTADEQNLIVAALIRKSAGLLIRSGLSA
jgi:hypothetical protein